MGRRIEALCIYRREGREVIEDAGELRRKSLHVVFGERDARQPGNVKHVFRGEGHAQKRKASAQQGTGHDAAMPEEIIA